MGSAPTRVLPAGQSRNPRRRWSGPGAIAAAVIVLGAALFFKLDQFAGVWLAKYRPGGTAENPGTSADNTARPVRVVNSLALRDDNAAFIPGEIREFPDLNLRFRLPGETWTFTRDPWSREGGVFSMERISSPAAGRRETGPAWFALRVVPPDRDRETESSRNGLPLSVKAVLEDLGSDCRVAGHEDVRLDGLHFHRVEVENLVMDHQKVNAEVWLCDFNGMVYELVTAMPARTPAYYLSQTARRLAEGFGVLDSGRRLRGADVLALLETAGSAPVRQTPVVFENVAVALNPSLWSTWPAGRGALPGATLAFASRSGLRVAAAFAPAEGIPEGVSHPLSLTSLIWPALRNFQWTRSPDRQLGGLQVAVIRGTGELNNRQGRAEVRAVPCGKSLMFLFAFGPGDTKAEVLTAALDLFRVKPGGNGAPDFGVIEDRLFHRAVLGACAEDASANGRHGEAAAAHLVLFEWDRKPGDLCLAVRSLAAAGKKEEAFQTLTANEGNLAGEPEWEGQKLLLLASTGQPAEAAKVAAQLLRTGALASSVAGAYIETLMETKAFAEARAFVTLLREIDPSPVWPLYQALLMAETGDRTKAAAVVRAVRTSTPDDVELGVECVNVLMRCRLFPEALELARFLALTNPRREQVQLLAAACHTLLGHTAEARDAYQKIIANNPGCIPAKEALQTLAASSGQDGTGAVVNDTLAPVPLPDGLAARLPAAGEPLSGHEDQPAVHLYRVTGVQVHAAQPLRQTVRGAVRIVDEEGMAAFNTMRFPVLPQVQRLCIHHLKVLDAAGNVTGEARLQDHYSLDSASGGMAVSGKVIHLPVPGLAPGCTIEYAYTIEATAGTGPMEYSRHLFALPEPCRMDAWYLSGDASLLKLVSSHGMKPGQDGDSLVWIDPQPALLGTGPVSAGTHILYAGAPGVGWERLGRDYLDRIRDRLRAAPELTRAAKDATAGLKTRKEKVAALTALVRDRISYTAIEFGSRAIIPNPAAATLANRYGDCKDQSVLLHELLKAAGIPSRLCLVNSRGDIQPDFPSLAQFDHMIVALPAAGRAEGFDFVDPTNKYLEPVPGAAPMGLEGRQVLVLDPAKSALVRTPRHAPPGKVGAKRDISLLSDETAVMSDTITLSGSPAARLRALLGPLPPLDRQTVLRQLIGFNRLSQEVQDLRIHNIKELRLPLRLEIQWEARDCVRREQGKLRLSLPAVIESFLLTGGQDGAESPDQPLHLPAAVAVHSESVLHFPAGYTPGPQPAMAPASAASSFGKWSLTVNTPRQGREARVAWECHLRAAELGADEKRPFADFTRNALRRLQEEWEFTSDSVAVK